MVNLTILFGIYIYIHVYLLYSWRNLYSICISIFGICSYRNIDPSESSTPVANSLEVHQIFSGSKITLLARDAPSSLCSLWKLGTGNCLDLQNFSGLFSRPGNRRCISVTSPRLAARRNLRRASAWWLVAVWPRRRGGRCGLGRSLVEFLGDAWELRRNPSPSVHIKNTPYEYGPDGIWKFPTKNHGLVERGVFSMNGGWDWTLRDQVLRCNWCQRAARRQRRFSLLRWQHCMVWPHWPFRGLSIGLLYGKNWDFHDMGVSINGATPKWMVDKGKSPWNGWFRGTLIFGSLHMWSSKIVSRSHSSTNVSCGFADENCRC